MKKTVNLRTGNITKSLVSLALPLMGMSFVQMAYNLIDMFWIGRLGAGAVASVGTGGLLVWLSMGIHTLAQVGGQVFVGQNLGREEYDTARCYGSASIWISVGLSTLLGLIFFFGKVPIIAFFNLNSQEVILGAQDYIAIVGGCILFQLLAKLLTSLITATGDSRTPFFATTIGLVLNIALDPIMIFGWFGFPALGIVGAAIATVLAQGVMLGVLLYHTKKNSTLFAHGSIFHVPEVKFFKDIVRLGFPTACQATFFPLIAMVLSRMVASFGDNAVAVQRIGSQVESISWMTTDGFAIAVNSFMAQNFGAGDLQRTKQGYRKAMMILSCWGLFATMLLVFGATWIFHLFIEDPVVIAMGRDYLIILGLSQLFMCGEILSSSAMNALGRTFLPALVVIFFTFMRLPMSTLLTQTDLGLNGVWWSVTISTIFKGAIITGMMFWLLHHGAFRDKQRL